MSRSRKTALDHFFDTLCVLPWWCSVAVGGVTLVFWGIGLAGRPGFPFHGISGLLLVLILLIFGGIAALSLKHARRQRITLLKSKTLRDLQAVPWHEFEQLAGACYGERGFTVVHTAAAGPDGGFNLDLRKDGGRIIVQCKRYRGYPVDVQAVREFFGVVVSEGANGGIFITSSRFTPEAMEFGLRQASLELIPGEQFAEMVSHLRGSGTAPVPAAVPTYAAVAQSQPQAPAPADADPAIPGPLCCPRCAAGMAPRTARRGPSAGQTFWGCSRFPVCTGTRPMDKPRIAGAAA